MTDEDLLLAAAGGDPAKRIWLLLIDNGYVFHRPRADTFEVVPAAAYLAKCLEVDALTKVKSFLRDWDSRLDMDRIGHFETRINIESALRAAEPGEVGR